MPPGLCWTAGPEGGVDSVGGRWADWTAQQPEQALGAGWFDALHPDDAPRIRSLWHAATASGEPFSARFRVGPGLDGRTRSLIALAEPLRDASGRPIGWSGLAMLDPDAATTPVNDPDALIGVTDADADEAIAGAGARPRPGPLDGPGDGLGVGVGPRHRPRPQQAAAPSVARGTRSEDFAIFWIASSREFRLASVSPSCERLLGRSVAELTGRPCSWIELAHPDDRPLVADAYRRRSSGDPVTIDYRVLLPDGATTRVRDRVLTAMTRSMGDPDRVFGVLEDVEPGPESEPGPGPSGRGQPATTAPAFEADEPPDLAPLIDMLGDLLLVLDGDGRCRSANDRAASLLGLDRPRMIGRPLDELFPELADATARSLLRRSMDRREPVAFEVFSDRLGLWLEFRAAPMPEGLALVARDVTEAKVQHLALLEVEERYRLSSEAAVSLIYDWHVETGHVHRSPGLSSLLGYAIDEAEPTDRWWHDRIHPDDLPRIREHQRTMEADRERHHYDLEYRIRHRDGHYVDVWDKGFCLRDPRGRIVRVVGTTLDISERHRSEQALREADRMKTEFLGVLAHELRNPLGPILAAVQALRSGAGDAGGELTAIIERQARHMSRLVEDLLDVSRINHGKILVRPEPLDLAQLARQAFDTTAELFREHGLELRAEWPDRPVPVEADPTRLSQCLTNLLHNASKFTRPGGSVTVRVGIEAPAGPAPDSETDTATDTDRGSAFVEVEDTGVGIPPEVLPTLFHAYWQAGQSQAETHGGLGLGLALVKNLMELQGGRVEADSAGKDRGSTFRLVLPLHDAASGPQASPADVDLTSHADSNAADPPGPARPQPLRLLVVDDRPDMAHILGRLLRAKGHQVFLAEDAEQALALARQERPQVVISDIGLPGPVDGYGLAQALRADPDTCSAILIAITGYARPDDRARAFEAGFDDHLTKPLDFSSLCDRLGQLTRRPFSF